MRIRLQTRGCVSPWDRPEREGNEGPSEEPSLTTLADDLLSLNCRRCEDLASVAPPASASGTGMSGLTAGSFRSALTTRPSQHGRSFARSMFVLPDLRSLSPYPPCTSRVDLCHLGACI